MRSTLPILLAAALAALAAPAAARPFDPYDTAALVEHAREAMRDDDLATACVLLSRASVLAPHDARVALAWGDYASRQQGLPASEKPAAIPAEAARVEAKPVAPEPPALWPAK